MTFWIIVYYPAVIRYFKKCNFLQRVLVRTVADGRLSPDSLNRNVPGEKQDNIDSIQTFSLKQILYFISEFVSIEEVGSSYQNIGWKQNIGLDLMCTKQNDNVLKISISDLSQIYKIILFIHIALRCVQYQCYYPDVCGCFASKINPRTCVSVSITYTPDEGDTEYSG